MRLQFRPNRTFTILQFTDIHWNNGGRENMKTRALMERAMDENSPDLVMLTGDILEGARCGWPADSWNQAVHCIEDRDVPWAAVFGNHDDEGGLDRAGLMEIQLASPYCLTQPGPRELPGEGNYVLEVADSRGESIAARLFCLDSLSYPQEGEGKYAWVTPAQIEWFRHAAAPLEDPLAFPPLDLVFLHIPLPEFNDVWETGTCIGRKQEWICCPDYISGFFQAMVETGSILGVFAGHDHLNDFCGELSGIRLCYGRATGYGSYGKEGFARGARVIRLSEGLKAFGTWVWEDPA